jgi:hypothetical protein
VRDRQDLSQFLNKKARSLNMKISKGSSFQDRMDLLEDLYLELRAE